MLDIKILFSELNLFALCNGLVQVDIMFMLSGFLLVFNLLDNPSLAMPSLVKHTLRRALR